MLNLKAFESTSSTYFYRLLKRGGLFRVHSLFDNSVNLVNQDNEMININHQLETLTSIGLKIDQQNFLTIRKDLRLNDIVKLSFDRIVFYTHDNVINLQLLELTVFKPFPTLINSKVFDHICSITNLKPDQYLIYQKLSLQDLVGRGIGFTPSGDDYNWGYLMIQRLFNKPLPQIDYSSTTSISQSIYDRLIHDEWGWVYVQLFESKSPQEWINILMEYGHTSGQDTLFGMQNALIDLNHLSEF